MARILRESAHGLFPVGLLLNKAGDSGYADTFTLYRAGEVPGGDTSNPELVKSAFAKARKLAETNLWLKGFLATKCDVLNYGLTFSAGEPRGKSKRTKKALAKDAATLMDWLESPISLPAASSMSESEVKQIGVASGAEVTNRERLTKFVLDTCREFLLLDNCIAAWTEDLDAATVIAPELCRYKDVLGIETLFYLHGLTAQDKKLLTPADQERFKESELMFDPKQGTYFRVLKRARTGFGFGWPTIQPIFRLLAQIESMELGESYFAFGGRVKFRFWKKGHEIKQGPHAGRNDWFWKPENSRTIKNAFDGKSGFMGDFVGNFDWQVDHPHEPIDYYKAEKWQSAEHRFLRWAGPLAIILSDKGRAADLLPILRAEIEGLRGMLGRFLESVINQAWNAPVPIRIGWSNTIFQDARVAAEDRKSGLASGALSQSTWREVSGFDDQRESIKKEAEAEEVKANPEKFRPAFDAAHGLGDDSTTDGKPSGGSDADGKNQAQ